MKYKLYQIPLNEETRFHAFERKEDLERRGMYPPPRNFYKLVFEDDCYRIDPIGLLHLHNRDDRPARYRIRSMSTSDILVYELGNEQLALFRDYVYYFPVILTDDKINDVRTEYFVKDGYAYVKVSIEDQTVEVNVPQMLNGGTVFKDQAGNRIELTATHKFAVLQCALIEQDRLKYNGKKKTSDEWTDSGAIDFDAYVGIGDEVDEAIVDNFLEMLPPALHTSHLMQMGEPNAHLQDDKGNFSPTFMTFEKVDGKWYYRGYCFYGKTENRKRFPTYPDMLEKLLK